MEFPLTKVYIFCSSDADILKRVISNLTLSSSHYRPIDDWELNILLKYSKLKEKNTISSIPSSTAGDKISEYAYYFLRFYDSDCLVCTPRDEFQMRESSVVTELHMEDKVSKKNDLSVRTSWKVTGRQFYIDSFIIGFGIIEQGQSLLPVFEITLATSVDNNNLLGTKIDKKYKVAEADTVDNLSAVLQAMDALVKRLLVDDEISTLKGFHAFDYQSKDRFEIADRAIQWIQLVIAMQHFVKTKTDSNI